MKVLLLYALFFVVGTTNEADDHSGQQIGIVSNGNLEKQDLAPIQERKALKPNLSYTFWPDGIVYFAIHRTATLWRDNISRAMDHWMDHTCIRFIKVEENAPVYHVVFRADDVKKCDSLVGMHRQTDKGQDINIGASVCKAVRTLVHEIGHAIGFYHEQERHDRDEYVNVYIEGMSLETKQQYDISDTQHYNVPFDHSSIMLYKLSHLMKLPREYTSRTYLIGTSEELSFHDKELANKMYKCDAKCNNQPECKNNGYIDPNSVHHQCRCLCPDGYEGYDCSISRPIRCGNIIGHPKTLTVPNHPVDRKCTWKILSKKGKFTKINFKEFDLAPRDVWSQRCTSDILRIHYAPVPGILHNENRCGYEVENETFNSVEDITLFYHPHSDFHKGFIAEIYYV